MHLQRRTLSSALDQKPSPSRSAIMRSIRKTDTKPEKRVRCALHRRGFRFTLHAGDLPGTPDIVLPKYSTVIQVRGCFWHQHSCRLGKRPKSNLGYWLPKLERNKRRDRLMDRQLRDLGWSVHTIWECQCVDEGKLRRRIESVIGAMRERE